MNPSNKETILIVNNDVEQLEKTTLYLEQAGYRVITAPDLREGFETARQKQIDLIIGDAVLFGGDGIELCQSIQHDEELRTLPILLVSQSPEEADRRIADLKIAAADYIELPIEPWRLITKAARLIERKRMEALFRKSESYFRTLIENVSDIISILSDDGIVLYESPAIEQILGYKPDELVGKNALELIHPDDRERVFSYFKKIINAKSGKRGQKLLPPEYRYRTKKGAWRILESIGKAMNDPLKGTVALINSRDVTERRQAEKALRESQNQLQTIFDNAAIGIALVNLQGFPIQNNPAFQQMLGYTGEELRQMPFSEFTHPDDIAEDMALTKEVFKGKRSYYRLEKRYIKKGGEVIWGCLTVSSIPGDKREPRFILGMVEDVTERKQAEQGLCESEENFRALVLATTQHVWTIKENGDNAEVSQWWMNLTGQTFEKLDVAHWLAAIHPEDREKAHAVWQNEFANKILFETSYNVRIKTGEYRHFAVRGVPVFNTDGSFRQWIGTFNDITEHKQAEEALRKSREQLRLSQKLESVGRLAGGIAHDFNNMLTVIKGYSELTLRRLGDDNPLRCNIEEIKKAAERSASLTHQLLAFSRQQVLQSKVVDLNEIIIDTTKMLERLIGADIHLQTDLDAKLGNVLGDDGQLTQVIINLAVNARDAMPKGGNLTMKTSNVYLDEEFAARFPPTQPGSYIQLAVTDTGVGIESEEQEHLFEPFYTTKEIGKGTGLGLATVYGIVKQSGGYIWVDSEVGFGATFRIYLPCIDLEVKPEEEADISSESIPKGRETVLIVEDETMVRTLTRQMLEECGYRALEARSGAEALLIIEKRECEIDLVMTDVVMPQMSGRELAENLAEYCPQMRVLFTSGYTDDEIIRHDVITEETNFIQKPFTIEALAHKVRSILDA